MLIISHASEMRGLRPTSASSRPRLPAPPSVDLPKGLVITPPSGPPVAPGRACGGWRNVHKLRASPKEEARRQDGTGAARQHSHIPPRESRQHRPRRAFLGGLKHSERRRLGEYEVAQCANINNADKKAACIDEYSKSGRYDYHHSAGGSESTNMVAACVGNWPFFRFGQ